MLKEEMDVDFGTEKLYSMYSVRLLIQILSGYVSWLQAEWRQMFQW
jgi:hypothetical protein